MLAVLHVAVQFNILVPDQTQYQLYTYRDGEYDVTVGLPGKARKHEIADEPEQILIDGKPAFFANAISAHFTKATFDRSTASEIDPPYEVLNRAVRSMLVRLKYVLRTEQVQMVELPECAWRLEYRNDDGTELEQKEGLVRARSALAFEIRYVSCAPVIWEHLHSLPPDFEPPPWHTLLVDSRGALPHVGTAVVLAATALEVLIAQVLSQLAATSTVPRPLWEWINDRGDWQKEPSVEEQYSVLLQVLSGHSLKEDNGLWESFKALRKARNSFVHEGVARTGRIALTTSQARDLIRAADRIAAKVREWMPEGLRWPVFDGSNSQVEITKVLLKGKQPDDPS